MKQKIQTMTLMSALKPRNLFAVLARKRHAGRHHGPERQRSEDKDLVQRLREAGM